MDWQTDSLDVKELVSLKDHYIVSKRGKLVPLLNICAKTVGFISEVLLNNCKI